MGVAATGTSRAALFVLRAHRRNGNCASGNPTTSFTAACYEGRSMTEDGSKKRKEGPVRSRSHREEQPRA